MLRGSPIILEAVDTLARAVVELAPDPRFSPVEPRVLLVGGYVRDLLLGREAKDCDVEVYGVEANKLHELVVSLFPRVELIGSSFGILKVWLAEGHELDIGVPRKESKVGKGHRGFVIESDPALPLREAARRRDFTVNAIAIDPLTEAVHDPFSGLEHLQRGELRYVDRQTFIEDPLRVYRGVQLAARLEFGLEDKTFALMKDMVARGELTELSKERVTDELKKLLLRAEAPSRGFDYLRDLGVIDRHYPELAATFNTQQEPEWHPEGTVWTHTLMVIDAAATLIRQASRELTEADRLTVMLAALCHDLGKPLTTKIEDGRVRSRGHEDAGEAPTREFFSRLAFSKQLIEQAVRIVKDHLKPSILRRQHEQGELDDRQYANATRRLLKRLGDVPLEVFLTVTEADTRGRGFADALTAPYVSGQSIRQVIAQHDLLVAAKEPLLSGGEIIELLGLPPGPRIGELVKLLESARDEGLISTKDAAIDFLQTKI